MSTQIIDTSKLEQEQLRKQIALLVDQYAAIEFASKVTRNNLIDVVDGLVRNVSTNPHSDTI